MHAAPSPDADQQEVAIRKLLWTFPAEAHSALDDRLEALWHDVTSGDSFESLQASAKGLLDDLQGDPNQPNTPRLIRGGRDGWEVAWLNSQKDGPSLFAGDKITSNPVVESLWELLHWMAMLVKESNSSVKGDDHKKEVEKALRHYLELRGRKPGNVSPPQPDGPFGANKFRFAGAEVPFGRAALQRRLVLTLWDEKAKRPAEPRAVEDVMADVYGEDHETSDAAFRQLCSDTRRRLQSENCPLDISQANGMVQLVPR